MINWGDPFSMPDPNEGWQNPHKSGIARLGTMFDVTNYIPGMNAISKPIHNMAEQGADFGNRVLSPIVGAAQKFTEATTPGMKQVQNAVPAIKRIDDFVRNKPVDALAIAAATFFSGGSATPALSGAGTGGTLSAAGTTAATSAITPTLATAGTTAAAPSAAAGLGSVGAAAAENAITPALASAGGAVSSSAPGMLGTAGTAALENAIPTTYPSLLASAPSTAENLLNTFSTTFKPLKAAKARFNSTVNRLGGNYIDNLDIFSRNEPDEQARQYNMADQLAQRVLNDQPKIIRRGW